MSKTLDFGLGAQLGGLGPSPGLSCQNAGKGLTGLLSLNASTCCLAHLPAVCGGENGNLLRNLLSKYQTVSEKWYIDL